MTTTAILPDELADAVERERLMEHLAVFAERVKLSGTPSELESLRYLELTMAGLGYHTTLMHHDAYISLPGRSEISVEGRAVRSITHSMAPSTPPAGLEGELVAVGEGTPEDFADRALAGTILLVQGIASEETAVLASRAGALALIHVSPNEHLYELCISPVWGSPSQLTRDQLPSMPVATIANEDGAALLVRCQRGDRPRVRMTTEVDTGWRTIPLLVAELDAPEPEAPFVLFSGHHDSWHYGVMDNGSANATMIEAARILAQHRARWRRGLRLCFWSGHSHGRYAGSAWYADEFWDELDRRCVAHVNIDSTGGRGADVLTNSGVADELKRLAADEIRAVTGQHHAGRRHGRVADQSFWGVGVPSMFGSISHHPPGPTKMPVRLGWWWHTPHDLIEHIEPQNLVRDTRVILRVLARLLTDTVVPLDYADYADALLGELEGVRRGIGCRLDLGSLIAGAEGLKQQALTMRGRAERAGEAEARRFDRALMLASRALVPLNYTYGDRFRHDPALALPPWPALEGLRTLAMTPDDSPDSPFCVAHARQTRNRVLYALREANEAFRGALDPTAVS
jgi:Peptidase family M28/PA domain